MCHMPGTSRSRRTRTEGTIPADVADDHEIDDRLATRHIPEPMR